MVKLYTGDSGKVHIVQGGYICNNAIGKVTDEFPEKVFQGTRKQITCKNCLERLN